MGEINDIITIDEKEEMLIMLNLLFKNKMISETEYYNVKARISTYDTESL